MSNDVKETPNEAEDKKAQEEAKIKREEFLKIRDLRGEILYTTTSEELEEALVQILSAGSYTKTFEVYGGKVKLTYTSISEKERVASYALMREYQDAHKDSISEIEMQSYSSKVNIAFQLVRVQVNNNITSLTQGTIKERIQLLEETPEEQIRLYNKYLAIFANITGKAFNSEEILKNS